MTSTAARLREYRGAALLTVALALVGGTALWGPRGALDGAPVWALPLLVALAAAMALYAPWRGPGVGLGAAALVPAAVWLGPAAAAITALLGRFARVALGRGLRRESVEDAATMSRWGSLPARLGQAAVATLAAVALWRLVWPADDVVAALGGRGLGAAAVLVGVYLATTVALEAIVLSAGRERLAWLSPTLALALLLDLAGLAFGFLVAHLTLWLGWRPGALVLLFFGAVALEAARQLRLRGAAELRIEELREATRAGHRIIFRNPDLLGIAEQIYLECRKVVDFEWFQFELLGETGGERSWAGDPDGLVREGEPEPPKMPPRLPGIHRRAGWRLIEREFGTDDELLARLRLWCDPRRLDERALELLDSLLPQIASSVQRALLDRVAKRDPLTDLPDRRAFDSHLARVFEVAQNEGTPMAVILCDLDSFKRINDLNGHAVGDQALLVVARLLESQSREEDFCCRLGGDEFAIVLERADGRTALRTAERVREAVARRRRSDLQTRIPLRVTAGVAGFPELPVRSPAELLELADQAMYEAKRRGKNRCLLHLGQGRFLEPTGEVVGSREGGAARPPTLFS